MKRIGSHSALNGCATTHRVCARTSVTESWDQMLFPLSRRSARPEAFARLRGECAASLCLTQTSPESSVEGSISERAILGLRVCHGV